MGDPSQDDRAVILTAIRRITAANGGTPPGVRRFGHLSGFRYRWQKYWLRWSDAVREAGFTPKSIHPRLEEGKMLEVFAALARELGRIPGFDDVTHYKRLGRELPAHTSYIAHFGGKNGLLIKLKRWADEDGERADVAAMIPALKHPTGRTAEWRLHHPGGCARDENAAVDMDAHQQTKAEHHCHNRAAAIGEQRHRYPHHGNEPHHHECVDHDVEEEIDRN